MIEFISPELAQLIQQFIDYFINLVIEGGYFTVFITMTLESALILIPSEVVMPFAGYMVYLGKLNFVLVGLIASLANLLGSIVAYLIGFYGGRPLIKKYGKYILIREHHVDMTEKFFHKYGEITVLVGRCLPIIRTFISLPAGFGKMNFIKFIIYTFIGSLPWNYALAYAGFALGDNWEIILSYIRYLDIVVLLAIIALIIWLIVRKVQRRKQQRTV
jgi:membrane protein DedA with SNARE-associated domain